MYEYACMHVHTSQNWLRKMHLQAMTLQCCGTWVLASEWHLVATETIQKSTMSFNTEGTRALGIWLILARQRKYKGGTEMFCVRGSESVQDWQGQAKIIQQREAFLLRRCLAHKEGWETKVFTWGHKPEKKLYFPLQQYHSLDIYSLQKGKC